MSGQQLAIGDVTKFVLAGNATFTVARPARTRNVVREIGGVEVQVAEEIPAARYTFKLQRAKGDASDRPWFAKVLTGSDNETSYTFAGSIFPSEDGPQYRHSFKKSPIGQDAPSIRCLTWLLDNLNALAGLEIRNADADMFTKSEIADEVAAVLDTLGKVEVWHEGKCCKCGRKLTVPASIASGIGPECASKMAGAL